MIQEPEYPEQDDHDQRHIELADALDCDLENASDDSSSSSEDVLYYVQPKLTQCLECLDDQGTLSQLSSHMITSGHLNISWAAQTNVISENGVLR